MQEEKNEGGEHGKKVTIIVNGREEIVAKEKISYEEIVVIAYPDANYEGNTYKVTYFKKDNNHERVLTKGESVDVKNDMVFTVIRTIRS